MNLPELTNLIRVTAVRRLLAPVLLALSLPAHAAETALIHLTPLSQTVAPGQDVTLTAKAVGPAPITYQWFRGNTAMVGERGETLVLTNAQPSQAGPYSVQVDLGSGATPTRLYAVTSLAVSGHTFSLLAGGGKSVAGLDSSLAAGRLLRPLDACLDTLGNLWISDAQDRTVRRISPAGVMTTMAGQSGMMGYLDGGRAVSLFGAPTGICSNRRGGVYVCDAFYHTIREISAAGEVTTLAGLAGRSGSLDGTGAAARFYDPEGVAVDAQGNLRVSDSGNSTIRKVTPSGVVTTIAGSAGRTGVTDGTGAAARFVTPLGIVCDATGRTFVADQAASNIRQIDDTGTVTTVAGSPAGEPGSADGTGSAARFWSPTRLNLDPARGELYVADYENNAIRRVVLATRAVTTVAGNLLERRDHVDGAGPVARFSHPAGLAMETTGGFDAQGNPAGEMKSLFVVEDGDHVVRRISPRFEVSTFFGEPPGRGLADGNGRQARFRFPIGLTLEASGSVIVADTANQLLRRISPAGQVTTVSNGGGKFGSITQLGIDPQGRIYACDVDLHVVWRIEPGSGAATVVAGQLGTPGSADGGPGISRLNSPDGIAVDSSGIVYISDTGNSTIRRLGTDGVLGTFAGQAGRSATINGVGTRAAFANPRGLALDANGSLYVADDADWVIRRITPDGTASIFAGTVGSSLDQDGPRNSAGLRGPMALAFDRVGNLWVVQNWTCNLRKITPDVTGRLGEVTTVRGPGSRFFFPQGIVVDNSGALIVSDSEAHQILRGVPMSTTMVPPANRTVFPGQDAVFSVTGTAAGETLQWQISADQGQTWSPIAATATFAGANTATLTVRGATPTLAGTAYRLLSTGPSGAVSVTPAAVLQVGTARLVNLSVLSNSGTGADTLIAGFAAGGAGTAGLKSVLVRGIGPALGAFGLDRASLLADPVLTILRGTDTLAANDNWGTNAAQISAANAQVGAFALPNAASADSALVTDVPIGAYSAQVSGRNATTGLALVEVYDRGGAPTATTPRLVNLSARSQVRGTSTTLVAGFVVAGDAPTTVLVRAVGPTLQAFGVTEALALPALTLFDGAGNVVRTNAGWSGDPGLAAAFAQVGAFALGTTALDAALRVTLPPGNYTAQVSGRNDSAGVALVEVYEFR